MNATDDAVAACLKANFRPDAAAALLAAAQPLMAIAWDEGKSAGWDAARGESEESNPYQKYAV